MSFYQELPGIMSIVTLIGCCFFTFFHVAANIASPRGAPSTEECAHCPKTQKTQAHTNTQQFPTKAHTPNGLNHYEILEIPLFSSVETVKEAYHEKLTIYYPENFRGDEEEASMKIHQIRESYQVLTGKERCIYDFNLGSGIRRFVDCNQARLDREEEIFNEKRKEAKLRREGQKQNQAQGKSRCSTDCYKWKEACFEGRGHQNIC
ncbi:hypothetical protein F5Y00DRAFT_259231 [Daldinia vernicosa]|uniref:uncharacterized protein n=1 Tax=Daldinia vernicosa TaxID=114800 RepID=UPI0020081375|nr:uncharacterized protein F5Y00DRAFT_259231 [Daldinia vernicosa]KAI0851741.1 hypothetical protein F5Y00DRAFT_259231 [Daldinia vernicosa]